MKKLTAKDFLFYLVVFGIVAAVIYTITEIQRPPTPSYAEIVQLFEQEKVSKFVLKDGTLILELRDRPAMQYELYSVEFFRQDLNELILEQHAKGIITDYDYSPSMSAWWLMWLPYLALIVVFAVLWYFMFKRAGGGDNRAMNFKRANAKLAGNEKKKVTFNDVEGAKEEKEELSEIVEFLKNPRRFVELGARIPKGVLLVGPPGTGKTLIAKAVAGEAGVQFLSISGSDFVELYVGVGASRVRSLFEEAKKLSPSIIFIDEIDAVGRHRGAGMGGGHDEREQTLNQLLVEMDGFSGNDGVIIIAATNRPDILDPALLRPGRFDRQVYVGYPDIKGREAILRLHSKGKPLAEDVDLTIAAKTTAGFTGADLENLLNEAALLAARASRKVIIMQDLQEAMIKVIAGPEKRSKVVSDKDRRLTAYHEAGHAVVTSQLEHHDPVHQISIIPRGMAGGMNIFLPNEDKSFVSRSEMFENIVSCLGGRVAEEMVLDDISTGASNDIQKATGIARNMVTKYGMSEELGPINFSGERDEVFLGRDYGHTRNYSEEIASKIDMEIKSFIDQGYMRCREILTSHLDKLHGVADYLLEHEVMDAEAFRNYMQTGQFAAPDGAQA